MLASIFWNDFTSPTIVCVALLVAAILLGVVARRVSPLPNRRSHRAQEKGASTPSRG
jgi:hypothetical protein